MDCGISVGEGHQQPVGVELRDRTGQRHSGTASHTGREKREVNSVKKNFLQNVQQCSQYCPVIYIITNDGQILKRLPLVY